MQTTATKKENPIQWFIRYIRESIEELKKVSWPSREQTIKYSLLVIGVSVFVGILMAGLDWVLTFGLEKLISLTS